MLLGWIAIFHWGKALQGPLPSPTSANCRWSFIFSSNSHSVLYRLSVPPNALAAAMRALKTRWYSWSLCCFSPHPPKGCNFQHLYSFLNGIWWTLSRNIPCRLFGNQNPPKKTWNIFLFICRPQKGRQTKEDLDSRTQQLVTYTVAPSFDYCHSLTKLLHFFLLSLLV